MFDKDLPTDLKTWNGHTHTEFCPHGSREDTELFIQQAIQSGFKTYTITEHFPMPKEFYENVAGSKHAIETAAMQFSELPAYFEKMNYLKAKYADKIKILIGFEVDYFEEFRDWTESMLAKYADEIDDAILSVHFLPTDHGLRAVDDSFADYSDGVLYEYETPVKLANAYLKMVLQAIKWESAYKPKRYGHITLYRKWIKKLPENTVWEDDVTKSLIDEILNLISSKNELLDCNMSGINRKTQQEPSPYMEIIKIAKSKNIRLVYGADVHESINVAQGYQEFLEIGD